MLCPPGSAVPLLFPVPERLAPASVPVSRMQVLIHCGIV